VVGVGPKLLDDVRPWVTFSGIFAPRALTAVSGKYFRCFNFQRVAYGDRCGHPGQTGHILVREGLITRSS